MVSCKEPHLNQCETLTATSFDGNPDLERALLTAQLQLLTVPVSLGLLLRLPWLC